MTPANVLPVSNSIPVQEVFQAAHFLCFSCLAVPDRHTGREPWLTVRQAEETCHSSAYQRVRGLFPSCLSPPLPPPPPSSSLPESSPCYLLNGLVTTPPAPCSSLQDLQKSQEKKTLLTLLRQTPAPLQGGLACLLTPVEWVVSSGSRRERSAVRHASSRRGSERTSHAFPFGADSTGAVDRCLPGSHAALPGGVGPLRCVQVPGLLRWRPDLGLHGVPTRGSRHDPVPEGYPGSPKCHMRRPSRDVLCPGEYKWINPPKMCPRNKQTNTAAFCLSCIFWQTPSKPLWPRKCLRLKT